MTPWTLAPAHAQAAWTLAPLLAARKSMRLWAPGVRYEHARRLTSAVPDRPAAIPVFDHRGRTSLLALDFDPTAHGTDRVQRDVDQALALIQRAGAVAIVDESTRGGRHILVPLARGADLTVAHLRPVLRALAAQLPTLDITPMLNPATGCITPPGSPCKEGGYRRLLTPLEDARQAATHRTPLGTIGRLRDLLGITQHTPESDTPREPSERIRPAEVVDTDRLPAPTGVGAATLPAAATAFALHGVVPSRRNRRGAPWTRHEARQSVLAHAAVRGLTLADVLAKTLRGDWAGLRAAYDRYGARWEPALRRDWTKALTWAHSARSTFRLSAHKDTHTGGQKVLREWLARAEMWTMNSLHLEGQCRWSVLAVLQALAYARQLAGTPAVAYGCRWLSLASGFLAEETVAAVLRGLRDLPGSPILLTKKGRGPDADEYALVIPRMNDQPVPIDPATLTRLRIEPVHPAWAVLGLATRRVYEMIDEHSTPGGNTIRPLDLPQATGMSQSQVYQALSRLADHNLITRGHGWICRTTRTLTDVAVDRAVDDLRAARLARHRTERHSWHQLLALWDGDDLDQPEQRHEPTLPVDPWTPREREDYALAVLAAGEPPERPGVVERPPPPAIRPPVEVSSVVALLENQLGARVLTSPH